METKQFNEYTPDAYRDIPVPYAAYEVLLNAEGTVVINTRYRYVNEEYCRLTGKRREELIGRLFLDVYPEKDTRWFDYCYRALRQNQRIHDVVYSTEIGHWLDFTIGPISGTNMVAYLFMMADEEHAKKMLLTREKMTDNISLSISKILNKSGNYEETIQAALAELAEWIAADRLYILETDHITASNTFEWCREGVEPQIDTLQDKEYESYLGGWESFLETDTSVVLDDIEILREEDPVDYENLKRQGIQRLIASPFYDEGKLIGYLGADNYEVSELVDTQKILETTAYFLGARLINHRLVKRLQHLSYYDELTDVRNRHSLQETVNRLLKEHTSVGIIYADVNGLKGVNDTGGHGAGDELLRQAAELIQKRVSKESVYREGGDEFVIVIPNITEEDFAALQANLSAEIRENGKINIALGHSWSCDSAKILEAIRAADQAMYQDKANYYRLHDRRKNRSNPGEPQ